MLKSRFPRKHTERSMLYEGIAIRSDICKGEREVEQSQERSLPLRNSETSADNGIRISRTGNKIFLAQVLISTQQPGYLIRKWHKLVQETCLSGAKEIVQSVRPCPCMWFNIRTSLSTEHCQEWFLSAVPDYWVLRRYLPRTPYPPKRKLPSAKGS